MGAVPIAALDYYKVYGAFSTAYNYTGIYQDNFTAPGAIYSADGWGCSLSSDAMNGQDQAWIEVSFQDSSYNALALYRSPVVTSNNIASLGGLSKWFDLQITNRCSYTNAAALILLPGHRNQHRDQSGGAGGRGLRAIPNRFCAGTGQCTRLDVF